MFARFKKEKKPLVYLDSASTAQMPQCVIDAVREFEETTRANVHRGIYELSERATECYEGARERVRKFVNARRAREIVFTRNTTESINLVAYSLTKTFFKKGDHILISRGEHHSNFLPWQMIAKEKGIILDILELNKEGEIAIEAVKKALHPKTRLAAFSHISHVLGTINPIEKIRKTLRKRNILFLVDAAQSAGHIPIDVQKIGCDFLAFSGHKMGAPMGIGVLYGREEIVHTMEPFLRGGGMIRKVDITNTEWDELPYKFEAGTPNVSGAIGLEAAINYITSIGFKEIRAIDEKLTKRAFAQLKKIPGIHIFGPEDPRTRGGVISFTIEGIHPVRSSIHFQQDSSHRGRLRRITSNWVHPHDLATILDREGIAIRAGHHCAMPLMKYLGVPAVSRISFWVYNSVSDIEVLGRGIEKALRILA
ncbi:MAG: cysteine desulfurase-like protein, SufS subfamily [Parcubacteria group bacterium Gr01-1014_33]|nr:MAG: cysteine desulfurase-like protein, SufS subfamily [Parcubacteria group bacterium Gr01-1014_33]